MSIWTKEAWQPLTSTFQVCGVEEDTMYMEAPCMRGWMVKAVTGRELLGQSWAERVRA
jgi:hypothetical protein